MARGALVRLLRLVEHRCARIVDLHIGTAPGEGAAVLERTVEARLAPAALARQIEKLYDVQSVEIVSERVQREP